jgi:hypothetical protein
MKTTYLGAFLCLGLMASCQSDASNEMSASNTETPAAFSIAKLTLEKVP